MCADGICILDVIFYGRIKLRQEKWPIHSRHDGMSSFIFTVRNNLSIEPFSIHKYMYIQRERERVLYLLASKSIEMRAMRKVNIRICSCILESDWIA